MSQLLQPGARSGIVRMPSSKSELHRLLVLAALSKEPVVIHKLGSSADITATLRCLNLLGANLTDTGEAIVSRGGISRKPIRDASPILLPCGESGTTLRFLLPLAGALARSVCFVREGRLADRPIRPLLSVLAEKGMRFHEEGNLLYAEGLLKDGVFQVPGNISSQFISGLLLALPLLHGDSVLRVDAPIESRPYIELTEACLERAGIRLEKAQLSHKEGEGKALLWDPVYWIVGEQQAALPSEITAEGDFSSAAFFLAMGALSPEGVGITGVNPDSVQGDMAVFERLSQMGAEIAASEGVLAVRRGKLRGITIDASQTPDLIPSLAIAAAAAEGDTQIIHASRLRDKESDRLTGISEMLKALGASAEETEDSLIIHGGQLHGGQVSSLGDHRLAMAAAVAACAADGEILLDDEACVAKSYGGFWADYASLVREQ